MKNNWLKITVIIALLINAATLLFFWWSAQKPNDRPNLRPAQILKNTLKLDEKQTILYDTLRERHHTQHDSLLKLVANCRQNLYAQKQVANDSILTQIGLLHKEIERITYEHFEEVRQICTPEQQAELDKLLEKMVQNVLMPKERGRKRPPRD